MEGSRLSLPTKDFLFASSWVGSVSTRFIAPLPTRDAQATSLSTWGTWIHYGFFQGRYPYRESLAMWFYPMVIAGHLVIPCTCVPAYISTLKDGVLAGVSDKLIFSVKCTDGAVIYPFARATSCPKPASSFTAMSARTFRSNSIPAVLSPCMNRL